jgi:CheY-like chemotaxis protein
MASSGAVLIVDDDPAMCEMLSAQLEDVGLSATVARSIDEALVALEQSRFSAVVTDLYMSPRSGFELLDAAKNGPPVILMSSFASDTVKDEGLSRGAVAVLAKPLPAR